jgi:hypothetical protein
MQNQDNSAERLDSSDLRSLLAHSSADSLLYSLATVMMKEAGHRYGTFLDSATTAAKLTIYSTYLEKGQSFRKTGNFYHIEPKRIKAIIREIEDLLLNSESLMILGSEAPSYLMDFPYLWLKTYPWHPEQSRSPIQGLTRAETQFLEAQIPESAPSARFIRDIELDNLLSLLYEQATQQIAVARWQQLSEPLLEHLKCRLLDAETIMRLDAPSLTTPLYALTRMSYSPSGVQEKLSTLLQDVARYFKLLLLWLDEHPMTLRAIETFEMRPGVEIDALTELDAFLRAWADKYHEEGGTPMILQTAVGPDDNPYFTKHEGVPFDESLADFRN